jgi:hypothetical protein
VAYSDPTLKRLFALSGNVCAFPRCSNPIIDPDFGIPVGEICHITGRKKGAARYDEAQTDEQRDAFENLILMCLRHHAVIDHKDTRNQFSVETLRQYKADHETNFENTPVNERFMQRFIAYVVQVEGSIIMTINQSGGQVAHSITNIVAPPPSPSKPTPILVPVIESHMSKGDTQMGIDYYDFRVRLRNEGTASARDFRIEIEIPEEFLPRGGTTYTLEVQGHNRRGVRLFRATEKSWPGTVIYPDTESDFQMLLSYEVRIDRYVTIANDDTIRVKVFAEDLVTSTTAVPIADYLSEDRCNMLWAPGRERPEALRHPRKNFPSTQK